MEKPKTKKMNQHNSQLGRCCGSCYNTLAAVTPKKGRNTTKNSNYRQAGDTKAPKSLNTSALHLKYGVFQNQPNFTRPGRQTLHQNPEHVFMTKTTPKRNHILAMNAHMEPNAAINCENEILSRTPSAKNKFYHHLSLSEVMHIDIKPPRKTGSPIYWTTPSMNTKYYRTPARGRSPKTH